MKSAVVLFGVVVGVLGSSSPEKAPSAPEASKPAAFPGCASYVYGGCSFGEHKLQGPSYPGYRLEEAHGDCRECVPGLPCHTECEISEEDESVQLAYKTAVDAARRGDVEALLDLMHTVDKYLNVNKDRGSIQLLSCDRSRVIANLGLAVAETSD